jgi:acetylornithine deacetylase/succinyl-diaminopimelate desuccinylase-like protein
MTRDDTRARLFDRLESERDEFVRTLSDYARVPTISAEHRDFAEGAEATRHVLEGAGARTRTMTADGGPPVVIGEVETEPSGPWIILYNHYDVQPVDPIEEWTSDPFDPVVRDERLYARGVSDTKGNTVAQAIAVRALRETVGSLPLNVRFFVEGEEESGSPHLGRLAQDHPELFRGLGATIEATGRSPDGRPVVALGSKGVLGVGLSVRTASVDQHSSLATSIPNAAWRLLGALAWIRAPNGRVRIPGFGRDAAAPEPEMLRYLRRNSFDPEVYREEYGAKQVYGGRTRFQRLKRAYYSPTCTIDGIVSGYTGLGHKTVNPATARATLDFRLLPGQQPKAVLEGLREHLAAGGFGDVELTAHDGFEPAFTPVRERFAQETLASARDAYGADPNVVPWSLGSSTTAYFRRMGTPALAPPGVGYFGSRPHAPNENIRLADAANAMKSFAGLLMRLAAVGEPPAAGS